MPYRIYRTRFPACQYVHATIGLLTLEYIVYPCFASNSARPVPLSFRLVIIYNRGELSDRTTDPLDNLTLLQPTILTDLYRKAAHKDFDLVNGF